MSLNDQPFKQNILHNINILNTKLDKEIINMNFYIDSYHLYKYLEEQASVMASLNERFFVEFHKRHIPELPINRYVFLDLIRKLKNKIQYKLHNELEEYYLEKGENICQPFDLFNLAVKFKNEKITDITKFFDDELALKKGWDKSHPRHLEQHLYVNFFYGELNQKYLINTLKKKCREEKNAEKKKQYEESYKSYEKNTDYDDKHNIDRHRYNEFIHAIKLFSEKEKNQVLTEVRNGETRFNIYDENTQVLVSFYEKGVDTQLSLKTQDDLITSKKNERFIFITNDGDFAPLLSLVREKKRRAILVPAKQLKDVSRSLKNTIPSNKIFTLYDVFKTNGLKLLAGEFFQDQHKLSDKDFLEIINYSNIFGSDFSIEYWDKKYLDYEEEEFNGYDLQPRDQFVIDLKMKMQEEILLLM